MWLWVVFELYVGLDLTPGLTHEGQVHKLSFEVVTSEVRLRQDYSCGGVVESPETTVLRWLLNRCRIEHPQVYDLLCCGELLLNTPDLLMLGVL